MTDTYQPYRPVERLRAPEGTKTGTVWIWLVAFVPLLSYLSIFLLDFGPMFRALVNNPTDPTAMYASFLTPGYVIFTLGSWVLVAAGIVFSLLDYRALKARGVPKPFHWAFAFFALAGYGIVYAIGRGVVVHSRTGSGMAPTVAAILVFAAGFLISIVWVVVLVSQMMALIPLVTPVPVS